MWTHLWYSKWTLRTTALGQSISSLLGKKVSALTTNLYILSFKRILPQLRNVFRKWCSPCSVIASPSFTERAPPSTWQIPSLEPRVENAIHGFEGIGHGPEYCLRFVREVCLLAWNGKRHRIHLLRMHASLVLSMANKPPQSPCDNMCPWQCVWQDIFELNKIYYLATVDHYTFMS